MVRRGWYPPGPGPQGGRLMATTESSAPSAQPSPDEKRLEERYRHELLSDEERQELRDHVLRLRRRLRLS